MPPTTIPPPAAAALRSVLSTPLEKVLIELTELAPPPHHSARGGGPGGARHIGGHHGGPQRVITLNHNVNVADALEKLARWGRPRCTLPPPATTAQLKRRLRLGTSGFLNPWKPIK
jgi:hypothetical protein